MNILDTNCKLAKKEAKKTEKRKIYYIVVSKVNGQRETKKEKNKCISLSLTPRRFFTPLRGKCRALYESRLDQKDHQLKIYEQTVLVVESNWPVMVHQRWWWWSFWHWLEEKGEKVKIWLGQSALDTASLHVWNDSGQLALLKCRSDQIRNWTGLPPFYGFCIDPLSRQAVVVHFMALNDVLINQDEEAWLSRSTTYYLDWRS